MQQRLLEEALQFAHIAGPGILPEHIQSLGSYLLYLFPQLWTELLQEVVHQEGEIISTLPQGGQDDRKDAEAVVQIAAELASGDAVLQITIGGGNDADVGVNGLVTSHAFKLLCLQYPQDLRLGERRHIADLIEKERAARTLLKLADAFALCTRKRSSLMAKQLAFQQRFGDSGTVDGQERGSSPLAVMVNRPRHQLFARASLAAYEHSDVLWRYPANGLVHILHGRTPTHQHIRRF